MTTDNNTKHDELRDFFAGCALIGILLRGDEDSLTQRVAVTSFLYADAMIQVRDKVGSGIASIKPRKTKHKE
jgi:hypothetical protein